MPILKFFYNENGVILSGLRMEDITDDKRASMLDRKSFLKQEYKIDKNIYLILNDLAFKIAKLFDESKTPLNAILLREDGNYIIVVPSRSYVFWQGKSVDPVEYKVLQDEFSIVKLLKAIA